MAGEPVRLIRDQRSPLRVGVVDELEALAMTTGYALVLDGTEYDAWKGGAPFTISDVWGEAHGVGNVTLLRPDRTVMLTRAGNFSTRMALGPRRWTARRGSPMRCPDYHPRPRRSLP